MLRHPRGRTDIGHTKWLTDVTSSIMADQMWCHPRWPTGCDVRGVDTSCGFYPTKYVDVWKYSDRYVHLSLPLLLYWASRGIERRVKVLSHRERCVKRCSNATNGKIRTLTTIFCPFTHTQTRASLLREWLEVSGVGLTRVWVEFSIGIHYLHSAFPHCSDTWKCINVLGEVLFLRA